MRAGCVLLLCLLFAAPVAAQPAKSWAPAPPKLLPNGGRPLKDVPFPAIRDWNSLVITFGSGPCNNRNCTQDYSFTLHGDGSFLYRGNRDVTAMGAYRGRIPQGDVKALVEGFRKARFFSLFDRYEYGFPPFTYTLGIAFDGHAKTVMDINGDPIGMPGDVIDLRQMLENALDADTYRRFTNRTIPLLRTSGWNFHRNVAANTHLLQQAITVTEFEGPRVVVEQVLNPLLALGVPLGNFFGCEVLQAAARTRKGEIVARLLAAGAPVQVRKPQDEREDCDALAKGVEGGDSTIVRQLLARHPDPNGVSGYERPLLSVLMSPGYVPGERMIVPGDWKRLIQTRVTLVRLLLDAGANPRLPVDNGSARTVEQVLRSDQNTTEIIAMLDAWDAANPVPPPSLPAKITRYLDRWLDAQAAKKP